MLVQPTKSAQTTDLLGLTRRHLLSRCGYGMGAAALAGLLSADAAEPKPAAKTADPQPSAPNFGEKPLTQHLPGTHHPAKAKSIILLHMAGAPSVLDLLDHKPKLNEMDGQACPDSYVRGQKFAFLRGVPKLLGSPHKFAPRGQSGQVISDLLPHLAKVADDVTVVRSMFTDQFNHAPGQLLWYTGFPRPGRPSLGSWLSYGLGSANRDLPTFVALTSGTAGPDGGNALWGSGFLPSVHQGVRLNNRGDPVMFLSNPAGMDGELRRRSLDALAELNAQRLGVVGDPEIATRISQFEMAYRMQSAVPELLDISREPKSVLDSYGVVAGQPSFAANCLLARRLVEKGVRLVQLHHWGWDSHGDNKGNDIWHGLADRCRETDQPAAALVADLKARGMLDSTLVIWGGEFGRTPMNENRGGNAKWLGRDHNQHSFSVWLAGGGSRAGLSYGKTDELGYHVAEKPVHVHDMQATVLHLMGMDHERLTYRFQGRDFRLTDVHGKLVKELIA